MTKQNLAALKPHIFKARKLWRCCMDGFLIGTGFTPKDAYDSWLERNLAGGNDPW